MNLESLMTGAARRFVMAVLLLSLVLKVGVFLLCYTRGADRIVSQDTPIYENAAIALLQTGRFSVDAEHPELPATLVPPGYPAFIAAIYAVLGPRRDAVVAAQILLSLVTLGLTFGMAARLWGSAAGRLALIAVSLDLVAFTYAQILFSETLFTATLMLACFAGVEHLLGGRLRWAAVFGAALAVTTLVRPITYYLFWPILVGTLVHHWRLRTSPRRIALVALAIALPWLLLVGGWRSRNDRLIGRPVVSDIQAVNLFFYRAAGVVALDSRISFYEAQRRLAQRLPDLQGLTQGEVDGLYEREAIRILAAHPLLLMRIEAFGVVKVLAGSGRGEFLHYYGGEAYESTPAGAVSLSVSEAKGKFAGRAWLIALVAFVFAHLAILFLGVLHGTLRGSFTASGTAAPVALIAGVAVYLVVVGAGPEAYARFRVPVMPFIAVFSAPGLIALQRRLAGRADAAWQQA